MNSVDFLKNRLEKLHRKFPCCNIRYEFLQNLDIHLVEVTPLSFFTNEDYVNEELLIDDEFKSAFLYEDLVFISNGSLNKITSPILELYSEQSAVITADFVVMDDSIGFESSIDESYELEIENFYALAA